MCRPFTLTRRSPSPPCRHSLTAHTRCGSQSIAKEGNPLPKPEGTLIVSLPQFTVNAISLSQALKSHRDEDDTFLLYITLEGEAVIQAHSNNYKVAKGDLIMIPAEVQDFALLPAAPDTVLLEVRMDPRPENDIVSEPIDDGSQD